MPEFGKLGISIPHNWILISRRLELENDGNLVYSLPGRVPACSFVLEYSTYWTRIEVPDAGLDYGILALIGKNIVKSIGCDN
jgi:hypothetical protein